MDEHPAPQSQWHGKQYEPSASEAVKQERVGDPYDERERGSLKDVDRI
jgi:hypothetical protein